MAEENDGQERTEQATPKKLLDARKKGQVPRSREMSTMLVTIAGAATLVFGGEHFGRGFMQLMQHSFSASFLNRADPMAMPTQFYDFFLHSLALVTPLMAVAIVAAVLSSVALGGWTFNLGFKLDRLDPVKGLKKLFALRALVELVKSIAKVLLVGSAAAGLLWLLADDLMGLGLQSADRGIPHAGAMLSWFFLMVSLPLIIIAAIDVPWQLYSFHKEMRMSRQEVRDEQKETDGRPEVKSKLREMQQAAAQRRMMDEVPKADVVITNPTHYAVALRYDEARASAPVVVAKGAELIAARIREIASENEVPLVESPRLARAVFASTDLGDEIPAGLYLAVAQILAYVYQLRDWQVQGGEFPEPPEPDVDDEFLQGLAP